MTEKQPSRFGPVGYEGYRVKVRLVRENVDEYDPVKLMNSKDVYQFMRDIKDNDRESFYSIHLDSKNTVISCEEVARGSGSACTVHPREVYKAAILSSAQAMVLVHNHPSGDPVPSPDDHAIIKKLYDCGELLGIKVHDSIIVGDDSYYSFADNGQLKGSKDLA